MFSYVIMSIKLIYGTLPTHGKGEKNLFLGRKVMFINYESFFKEKEYCVFGEKILY